MRIRPVPPVAPRHRSRSDWRAFTDDQRLSATILRMISLNSLAAFTQEVTRSSGIEPVRSASPASGGLAASATPQQRPLESVPAQPTGMLPRGSLLDLRV